MLRIRLTRVGKTNSPRYRVVVAEHSKAVQGKFIEILGHYNPTAKPKEITINAERANFWIERGAQASDTVNNLMFDLGILTKGKKVEKKFAKKFTKKQIKEGVTEEKPAETPEAIVEEETVAAKETAEKETAPTEEAETEKTE